MPACCSPSGMPGGSGRKLIAEQAGAAFPGALVADFAGIAANATAKPIATMIVVCILLSPCRKALAYTPAGYPAGSRVNNDRNRLAPCGRVRLAEFDQGFHQVSRPH